MTKLKKINCCIVDDEVNARELLRVMLERYAPEFNILGEAGTVAESVPMVLKLKPDVLFLDIELTDGTGFEVFEKLGQNIVPTIFITAFDHYAIKAIKANAFDYILKPIDYLELIESINKFKSISFQKSFDKSLKNYFYNNKVIDPAEAKLAIPGREETLFISFKNIIKCKAEKSYTWIFLKNGKKIISSKNLGEFEKLLPSVSTKFNFFFYRIHHNTIINTSFIKKCNIKEGSVLLENNDIIKISLRRKSSFFKALTVVGTTKK